MNETTEPNHYRLDIHLDGNGAKPHMVYKSKDVRKLLEMAYKLDRRADTIWLMWKEFVNLGMTRHLTTINPSYHKTLDEIIAHVLDRDAEIAEPIPVPENPPVEWV